MPDTYFANFFLAITAAIGRAYRRQQEEQCRDFDMEGAFDTFRWEYKITLIHKARHTVTLGTEITHSGNGNAESGA